MPYYNEIESYRVEPAKRDLAEHTRQVVCDKLKITRPAIRWIAEGEFGKEWFAENVSGWCAKDGRTIFIHRDYSPFEIASTTVHEARHCWQAMNPKWVPVPGRSYTRGLTREQKERDCQIFEMEFWSGREKRNGSFDEITRVLTDMQIEGARAVIQARSQQYAPAPRIIGLPYAFEGHYPSQVKMRLVVPSEREMEDGWLQAILNS